ncbi:hypothetical protein SAMN04488082_103243 [Desulfomicrobium apsheronum]|uniref:Uncharacterized protein n=2 Tax=Desulfomicrobium apsheronum TaxID=52560 RepID=A0A1I3RN59_9BACT|nr:hypothetical protein SAMN04488082_103243 [Desulfomicrobium apsheronum]
MTTSTNPTDDIIELTEIVEEGIPLDKKFEDFAMDKAVDAKSLDKELDDLLRDAEPKSAPAKDTGDEIDLDILFDEPAPAPSRPQVPAAPTKAQAPEPGMDISDLDDLFDSLGIGENDTEDTALDIILDGDMPEPKQKGDETFYPSDSIDLELEIPGMKSDEKTASIQDLTDDLLTDIPETVLLESTNKPEPLAPEEPAEAPVIQLDAPLGDEGELAELDEPAPLEPAKEQAPSAASPAEAAPEAAQTRLADEPTVSSAELEILSARLDALESRPEAAPAPSPEEFLAFLPQSPKDLPLAEALRREILAHVEATVAELASSASVDGLQESVNALQSQVESIPDIHAELAKTLPASAMQKIEADLDDLRSLVQNREEPGPEQILALLPQSPKDLPLAEALRQEILEHVEARVAELASSANVDGLQESVNALQSQVESIPDIHAELAKTLPASAMQKMEAELEDLRALVRGQEETLSALQKALSDKDAAMAALGDEANRLRAELDALAAKAAATPDLDAIRSGLQEYVQQQMPAAAAKIIREEIQALLQEMED